MFKESRNLRNGTLSMKELKKVSTNTGIIISVIPGVEIMKTTVRINHSIKGFQPILKVCGILIWEKYQCDTDQLTSSRKI